MLLAPSIHDLFSLCFPSFFPSSIHPPLLSFLLIHAGIDTQLSSIHPPELFPPRSTEGIGSYPSFSFHLFFPLSGQKKKKKLQTTSQDVLPGWYHPCAKALLFALTRLLLSLHPNLPDCVFSLPEKFWLHSENLLIQSYFIHPTLVPSLKTISVRSFMRMLKERVAVNMGMLFIFVTARTLTWRIGISSRSSP